VLHSSAIRQIISEEVTIPQINLKGANVLKINPNFPEIPRTNGMTAQEYIYQRLRHTIMLGLIAPGNPITIRGLAEVLDTSPTPVREALRRLSTEHALKLLPNRRIVVPQMTPDRFKELIMLRVNLEEYAARTALRFVSNRLVDQLNDMDLELDQAVENGDRDQLITVNQQFHRSLYTANPEQMIMPMIESVWLQLGPFTRIAARNVKELYVVDHHKEIIAALHQRDENALVNSIAADIKGGVGHLHADALERILG
jgi:DNA-binding GntR family transcriptional regulator